MIDQTALEAIKNTELPENLIFNAVITFMALLLHIMMRWQEARDKALTPELRPTLMQYINDMPTRVATAAIASVISFMVIFGMNWMNPVAALACGYMSNSLVDNFVKRYEIAVEKKAGTI